MWMVRSVERMVYALLTPGAEPRRLTSLAAQAFADIRAETDRHGVAAPVRRTYGRSASGPCKRKVNVDV